VRRKVTGRKIGINKRERNRRKGKEKNEEYKKIRTKKKVGNEEETKG
jgi:hypothetical protein